MFSLYTPPAHFIYEMNKEEKKERNSQRENTLFNFPYGPFSGNFLSSCSFELLSVASSERLYSRGFPIKK